MALVTLADLVVYVAASLRDVAQGVATVPGTGVVFTDTKWVGEKTGRFNGSEVIFLPPATGVTQANPPGTVQTFANGGSNTTFTLATGAALTNGAAPSYVLLNIAGRGYPYAEIVRALKMALDAIGPRTLATDESSLTFAADDYEYTIPAAFSTLESVRLKRTWGDRTFRIPLQRRPSSGYYTQFSGYEVLPGTRTLLLHGTPEVGDLIVITGEQAITLPTALASSIEVPLEAVVNYAREWLLSGGDQAEAAKAAGLYLDRLRTVPVYRRPNSIALP